MCSDVGAQVVLGQPVADWGYTREVAVVLQMAQPIAVTAFLQLHCVSWPSVAAPDCGQ